MLLPETDEMRREVARIRKMDWPHWPWLPMKKRVDGRLIVGALFATQPFTFHEGFNIASGSFPPENGGRTVDPMQLLREGWVVD